MATPAWESSNQSQQQPQNLDAHFKNLFDSLQKSKEAWKGQQRLSLFDSYQVDKVDQRTAEVQQANAFRQLQLSFDKVENELVKWRQQAAMKNDGELYQQCQEHLLNLLNSSCICSKQPPPIVDGDSKRSRPQVEIRVLTGKISNLLQDGQTELSMALLTDEQARNTVNGQGLPERSDYTIDWHGKGAVPLVWDATNRWFRARFTDLVLKKTAQKWLDGYHLYFYTKKPNGAKTSLEISCLSTPFEVVSNRTGQKPHKMRNEFWRLAFCTNDSNSSTVGLRSSVPSTDFLDIFDRWFRGFTGVKSGLTDEHKRSISQMLKVKDGLVTWERFKKNWTSLYHSAEYIKENQFLWNTGILKYCFATREETERMLAQHHEKVMLIRFQQSAPGYLSISLILTGDAPDDGRYIAHCPLESYFKRNYTLVQCIEYADLLSPTGKRLKAKLREFKIAGANDSFDYKIILEEDERTREQVYAMIQSRQVVETSENGAESGGGPLVDYSTVKERFKIKTSKFPEVEFASVNSPATTGVFSSSPTSTIGSPFMAGGISTDISPRSSVASIIHAVDACAGGAADSVRDGNTTLTFNGIPSPHAGGHKRSAGELAQPCAFGGASTNGQWTQNNLNTMNGLSSPVPPGLAQMNPVGFVEGSNGSYQNYQRPWQPQTLDPNSPSDCSIVFDDQQTQSHVTYGYREGNSMPYHLRPPTNPTHQQQADYSPNYQNDLDQSITDEDLSHILAAFNSFNGLSTGSTNEIQAPPAVKRRTTGTLSNEMGMEETRQIDLEMTSECLVPNR